MLKDLYSFTGSERDMKKFINLRYSNYLKLSEKNSLLSSHSERLNLGLQAHQFLKSNEIRTNLQWENYLTSNHNHFKS